MTYSRVAPKTLSKASMSNSSASSSSSSSSSSSKLPIIIANASTSDARPTTSLCLIAPRPLNTGAPKLLSMPLSAKPPSSRQNSLLLLLLLPLFLLFLLLLLLLPSLLPPRQQASSPLPSLQSRFLFRFDIESGAVKVINLDAFDAIDAFEHSNVSSGRHKRQPDGQRGRVHDAE